MEGVYGLLHGSAEKYPCKAFVQATGRVWSYQEADHISQNISEWLLKCGIQKGDRVVVFCDNSIQYITAFFGILRINAVAVPVNPAKRTESFLSILEKCTPKLILVCNATTERLDRIRGSIGVRILNIDCLQAADNTASFNNLPCGQEFSADENDAAEILFTSGTTADPKGVTLTHGNLLANTEAIMEYLKLTSDDSVLMTLPFTYSYGNSVLLTHVFAGAGIVISNSTAYPTKVLEEIKSSYVSGFSTVGSYMNLMLKCIRNSGADEKYLDQLRYLTFAGESANMEDIRFIRRYYPNIEVFVMYGQTEASARLSYLSPDLLGGKSGSVGRGLSNTRLRVVNEAGGDIKPGELGEIIAYGPGIMRGYWEDPEATKEVLKDGWLHTGDLASVDGDGYIYIKGRSTDIIKHMGHRLSPVEIENVINSCGYIKESAAVESIQDGNPVIKAYIVLEKECSLDEIKGFVYPRLPFYMRPQIFEVIGELPRTESGKIRRSALRRS